MNTYDRCLSFHAKLEIFFLFFFSDHRKPSPEVWHSFSFFSRTAGKLFCSTKEKESIELGSKHKVQIKQLLQMLQYITDIIKERHIPASYRLQQQIQLLSFTAT